jgi:CheY-like chemotaxis protein
MRILYVEDNPANLFLVQRVARMGNHEIIHYGEGQPALDHFKDDKPDLVLMDIQLPGLLSGLDVVKALRAAGHKTPIVAVTAYAMSGDREKCLEAGCDGYLSKPLPVGELVELFKRHDVAPKPASPINVPDPVAAEVKPEIVAASPSMVTPPVAIEKVEIEPPVVETVPVPPVIEAPAPVAKRDTSNDETIPSRPTLELKKAESVEAKIEAVSSQAVVEVQPVVVSETAETEKPKTETPPAVNAAASSPSPETEPTASTTDEKQPPEAPPISKAVPDPLKAESEKQG